MIGIINGLGKQGFSLVTSAVGYLITIAVIWFGVPVYGMDAYIWGSLISMAVTVIMNLCFIIKITGLAVNLRDWIIKPAIVSFACVPATSFAEYLPISNSFFHFLLQGSFACLTVLVLVVTMFKNLKWSDVLWRKFPKKK